MITAHGVTHPGRVRTANEDTVLIDAEQALRRAVAAEERRLFIGGPPVPSLARQRLDERLSR